MLLGHVAPPPTPAPVLARREAEKAQARAEAPPRKPKVYGRKYMTKILDELRATGPGTLLDIAVALNTTTALAKNHLLRMETLGMVRRELQHTRDPNKPKVRWAPVWEGSA
jgi:DNA-binding HxlR family transcriptional regulator